MGDHELVSHNADKGYSDVLHFLILSPTFLFAYHNLNHAIFFLSPNVSYSILSEGIKLCIHETSLHHQRVNV